jgi:hypothetical protein
MSGPANPWHDGGSSLPAWLLLRILLAAVAGPAAIAHGGATGSRGVTHAAAAPCDPRQRLAELASVCRAWLAALGANDVAQELCLTLHHLPAVLPPDMWRGALAPQPRDRVVYRSQQRGTVLSVDRSYDEPSFVVQLDDGPVRDCDAAKLQPTAPWRKLHLLLAAYEATRPIRVPQPQPGDGPILLQFGAPRAQAGERELPASVAQRARLVTPDARCFAPPFLTRHLLAQPSLRRRDGASARLCVQAAVRQGAA